MLPSYPLHTWVLPNGAIGAQIDANGGLSYIRQVAYTWPSANAAGVLTDNGSGTLSWAAAPQATHATNADLATWASHIAGASVSNAVAQATHATNSDLATWASHVDGSAVSNAVALATWASHVDGSVISNSIPIGSIPGLTYTLTVITNGTDTATLHFTNGVLGAVTAP